MVTEALQTGNVESLYIVLYNIVESLYLSTIKVYIHVSGISRDPSEFIICLG